MWDRRNLAAKLVRLRDLVEELLRLHPEIADGAGRLRRCFEHDANDAVLLDMARMDWLESQCEEGEYWEILNAPETGFAIKIVDRVGLMRPGVRTLREAIDAEIEPAGEVSAG